jgi:hypothetical protein
VTFDYKESGNHSLGFIAEEVAEVLPEAVQQNDNGEIVGSITTASRRFSRKP